MQTVEFIDWLSSTPVSRVIQDTGWIIPAVQSVHILAIATLIGSAIVLDLKLVGVIARTESYGVVFRRYMPWLWSGLAVLVMTGLAMVVGEPERVIENWVFWTKMGLVAIAFCLTLIMRVPMLREEIDGQSRIWPLIVKPLGVLALAIWVMIIFCGRWIAYAV